MSEPLAEEMAAEVSAELGGLGGAGVARRGGGE